jgi:hypothetical protein
MRSSRRLARDNSVGPWTEADSIIERCRELSVSVSSLAPGLAARTVARNLPTSVLSTSDCRASSDAELDTRVAAAPGCLRPRGARQRRPPPRRSLAARRASLGSKGAGAQRRKLGPSARGPRPYRRGPSRRRLIARSIAPIARALPQERYRVVRFDEGLRLARAVAASHTRPGPPRPARAGPSIAILPGKMARIFIALVPDRSSPQRNIELK